MGKRFFSSCWGLIVVMSFAGLVSVSEAATVETVAVGNTSNGNTWVNGDGGGSLGAVGYEYAIGKYEVTAGQYTEFLNAVAGVDTYGLYNSTMSHSTLGCGISRSGSGTAGDPYAYSVLSNFVTRPVNYVSWGDSARFANWLHNGQPTGSQGLTTTEDGAYYLNGATTAAALVSISREGDWTWALPTDSEWYKAGYHKNDGDTSSYFAYPTSSDSTPGKAKDLANFSAGPIDDPGNYANYGGVYSGVRFIHVGDLEDSASPYGTFDQAGNVAEWAEGVNVAEDARSALGGNFSSSVATPLGRTKYCNDPTSESYARGFRVVNVPEPATALLVGFGVLAGLFKKRKG